MDVDKLISLGFCIFGLGFFIFSIAVVTRDEEKSYNRSLREAREFGYDGSRLENQAINSRKRKFLRK